jgi:hypothetical protein
MVLPLPKKGIRIAKKIKGTSMTERVATVLRGN